MHNASFVQKLLSCYFVIVGKVRFKSGTTEHTEDK